MSISKRRPRPLVTDVRFNEDQLVVEISDGRTLAVPLEWFPRLRDATPAERNNWSKIGLGGGIHWEDIDEDISLAGLIEGRSAVEFGPKKSA